MFHALANFSANAIVALVIHHKQDWLDFFKIYLTVGEDCFIAVCVCYFAYEYVVVWEINGFYEFAFHVDAALFNHGGGFELFHRTF